MPLQYKFGMTIFRSFRYPKLDSESRLCKKSIDADIKLLFVKLSKMDNETTKE